MRVKYDDLSLMDDDHVSKWIEFGSGLCLYRCRDYVEYDNDFVNSMNMNVPKMPNRITLGDLHYEHQRLVSMYGNYSFEDTHINVKPQKMYGEMFDVANDLTRLFGDNKYVFNTCRVEYLLNSKMSVNDKNLLGEQVVPGSPVVIISNNDSVCCRMLSVKVRRTESTVISYPMYNGSMIALYGEDFRELYSYQVDPYKALNKKATDKLASNSKCILYIFACYKTDERIEEEMNVKHGSQKIMYLSSKVY